MQKLPGSDNKIFAKAAIAALDNKSIESFSRLMMHKSRMDERTLDRMYEILGSERPLRSTLSICYKYSKPNRTVSCPLAVQ
jgi:hypothetical protein